MNCRRVWRRLRPGTDDAFSLRYTRHCWAAREVSQSHMHHFSFSDRCILKRFAPLVILFTLVNGISAFALDWVPTAEELANYRKSWNPPTHGTSFASNADVTRQGQWFVRAYVQGMIGSGESQKNPSSQPVAAPFSPDA